MTIAFFSPSFPPEIGGMGSACYYTAHEIGKSHQATVFLAKRVAAAYRSGNYNIKILKPLIKFGYAELMPQILWRLKNFDIVHCYYPYFGVAEMLIFLKKIRGKKAPKIIFHYQMDFVGQSIAKFIGWLYKKTVFNFFIKNADKIFILSADYAAHSNLKKIYIQYPEKFAIIPNGVDTQKFNLIPSDNLKSLRQSLKLNPGDKIIFTAQALDSQHFFKGIDLLIKSLNIIIRSFSLKAISYKLIIAGDGNLKKDYQKLAARLGIQDQIIFLGNVAQNDLPFYYNLANITVVPSTQKTESFSITAAESMACGTPVIVSDLPGLRATIEPEKTGLLIQPNNPEDLVEKLLYLLNNPEKLKQFGQNSRARAVANYDWKNICENIKSNYRQLIANN